MEKRVYNLQCSNVRRLPQTKEKIMTTFLLFLVEKKKESKCDASLSLNAFSGFPIPEFASGARLYNDGFGKNVFAHRRFVADTRARAKLMASSDDKADRLAISMCQHHLLSV